MTRYVLRSPFDDTYTYMKNKTVRARLSSLPDLIAAGLIDDAQARTLAPVAEAYSIGLTENIIEAIENENPCADPVGRQYLPSSAELNVQAYEQPDPTGDEAYSPVKGIVHRYPDRVLLKITGACAVYCRFCFRRERVGRKGETLSSQDLEKALAYIRTRTELREVILTGGDPLTLSPRRLGAVLDALESMDHIRIIRLHSRVPAAEPERVTPALCAAMDRRKAVYLCVHVNHPGELTESVRAACRALHAAGCVLLSQSVLLKGVNDDPEILEALFRKLAEFRIKPYYLHHLDAAPGTDHFRVPLETGRALVRSLRGKLTGIAWPLYVLDIPGGFGKIPVGPEFLEETRKGVYRLIDPFGRGHLWEDPGA